MVKYNVTHLSYYYRDIQLQLLFLFPFDQYQYLPHSTLTSWQRIHLPITNRD